MLPKRLGGNDDLDNLIALTRSDHSKAHFELYEKHGDHKDLCVAYWLCGNHKEGRRAAARAGGIAGGRASKRMGKGIHRSNDELRKSWCSAGGKAGQKTQREKQISCFHNPDQHRLVASMGGKVGAFTMSSVQSENGRRGGSKNKGFIWLTDGQKQIKYTAKMQSEMGISEYLALNPSLRRGRGLR